MDYHAFYAQLFSPLDSKLGPIDPETMVAIIGFDAGGPLGFCTIGRHPTPTSLHMFHASNLDMLKRQSNAPDGESLR